MKKKYTAQEVQVLILDSATKLFIQEGFDATRVQDIMNPLDGLTKGAFYHHFESKDEVADKVIERLIPSKDVLDSISKNEQLTGLRKIQDFFVASMFDESIFKYISNSFELLNSPKFFLKYIDYVNQTLVPYIEDALVEGNEDGSLSMDHPKQTAELIVLVLSTWFLNAIFPNTIETFEQKIHVSQKFLKNNHLDILDDYVIERINHEISKNAQGITEE
ncbi:TetR/AcrR family transcriptional regulator [Erysipelothrix inopinata]|uniref:Biofilm operon icaADBC HTH-type negative transcriptional regulator IcaR n=1 Tax=Erysipelothrix inopinata TaxID=225084 RepID=A0A7G9S186_9FIRM|nr:TetR/AcrR family transcriptional regulator [Erysipelothrix inopinata]QNN61611.1 TetR/AcrR family transcriptional regulator [Erysipelothrix inopinata]